MEKDMSKTTIVALLVLTVVVSIACTWVVLDQTTSINVIYKSEPSEASGEVKVAIGEDFSAVTGNAVSNVGINIV